MRREHCFPAACKGRNFCVNFYAWTGNFTQFLPDFWRNLNFLLKRQIKQVSVSFVVYCVTTL